MSAIILEPKLLRNFFLEMQLGYIFPMVVCMICTSLKTSMGCMHRLDGATCISWRSQLDTCIPMNICCVLFEVRVVVLGGVVRGAYGFEGSGCGFGWRG